MGKNTNQIATWKDLYSIGYRLPDGKSTSVECITGRDLSSLPSQAAYENQTTNTSVGVNASKCVKWDLVPARNGQNPASYTNTSNAGVRVPVYCYLLEKVTGSTRANTFTFYYNYLLSGQTTWQKVVTGQIVLNSGNNISGDAEGVCYVLVNPYVSSNVTRDYLSVTCGTTNSKRLWYSDNIYADTGSSGSWGNTGQNATSYSMSMERDGSYNAGLQRLIGVQLRIGS
jgi:hypothetical protein